MVAANLGTDSNPPTPPLDDRLGDLLAYGVASGRLTDEEATAVKADVKAGMAYWEAVWAEYWSWREEVARRHREDQRRRSSLKAARDAEAFEEWDRLHARELAGKLFPDLEPEAYAAWRKRQRPPESVA